MLSYWLASPWIQFFLIVLGAASLVFAMSWATGRDNEGKLVISGGATVIGIALLALFYSGITTYVIEPNQVLLVIDKTTSNAGGTPKTTLYKSPGAVGVPFPGTYRAEYYPSNSNYQFIRDFNAAANDGTCVTIKVNFVLNAGNVSWDREFAKRNGNKDQILEAWTNELASLVKNSVQPYTIRQFTNQRDDVSEAIGTGTSSWFSTNGLPAVAQNNISLLNWDFCNPEISKAYDQALLAQTQVQQAEARLAAAEVDRQTELYKVDTQSQVTEKVAQLNRHACDVMGLGTQDACIQYLLTTSQQISNLVVSTGGSNVDVAVPLQPGATSYPTQTPTSVPAQ